MAQRDNNHSINWDWVKNPPKMFRKQPLSTKSYEKVKVKEVQEDLTNTKDIEKDVQSSLKKNSICQVYSKWKREEQLPVQINEYIQ